MLDLLLSQVAAGLVLGGLYVMIAIGLSIIFGQLGIVNFAHGSFFALGAYEDSRIAAWGSRHRKRATGPAWRG